MTANPRVVFGLPAFNGREALTRTLESLLSQTFTDLAIVIVDDRPGDEVREIVRAYQASDDRIVYEPNPRRLGMIGNWRRAFERARTLFPGSAYFAWASDHDLWHPRWLEMMVAALDGAPSVVLAYPRSLRIHPFDWRRVEGVFETAGVTSRGARLRATIDGITAGNAVYGLFRADALARAGVFRRVVLPDRQILLALSLLGEFRHVPEFLWYRRVSPAFSARRQRTTLFEARPPLHSYLPSDLQHAAALAWDFGVRGQGRPDVGRAAGLWSAVTLVWFSAIRWVRPSAAQARRARQASAAVEVEEPA